MNTAQEVFRALAGVQVYPLIVTLLAHDFVGEVPVVDKTIDLSVVKGSDFEDGDASKWIGTIAMGTGGDEEAIVGVGVELALDPGNHTLTSSRIGDFVETIKHDETATTREMTSEPGFGRWGVQAVFTQSEDDRGREGEAPGSGGWSAVKITRECGKLVMEIVTRRDRVGEDLQKKDKCVVSLISASVIQLVNDGADTLGTGAGGQKLVAPRHEACVDEEGAQRAVAFKCITTDQSVAKTSEEIRP